MKPHKTLDTYFDPHPYVLGTEITKFFGVSILRGWMLASKYEVKDEKGEILHFNTDEQFDRYMIEKFPGCFALEEE